MEYSAIPVESVQERDIDLLILEELNVSSGFCHWFISQLGLKLPKSKVHAFRSVTDYSLGETDILISYFTEKSRNFILVENKIDASFQENQFERYQERGENYVKNKECNKYFVVLIAPKSYCDSQTNFSRIISYESIKKYFIDLGDIRSEYKAEILSIAIDKKRRGYTAINSPTVQSFWMSYYDYTISHHQKFRMNKPDVVPSGSDWITLYSKRLQGITFCHKLKNGFIDVSFKTIPKINSEAPDWLEFIEHKKTVSIRVKCDVLDRTQSFNQQKERVIKGFEKLTKIEHWLFQNIEV